MKNKVLIFILALTPILLGGCGENRIWEECRKKTSVNALALRIRTSDSIVPLSSYVSVEISRRGEWEYIQILRERIGTETIMPNCNSIVEPSINPGWLVGLYENEVISFDEFRSWKVRPRTFRK
jgi:hypothetical protein